MQVEELPVVLYHYDTSPVSQKTRNILALKGIAHKRVDVGWLMPRPALSELLGITYRRIPVLAIGNDVYFDSSLIASTLERRFPLTKGYATLFPKRNGSNKADIGLVKAMCMYYFDRVVFPSAAQCIPIEHLPDNFKADRRDFFPSAKPLDPEERLASRSAVKSALSSHLTMMEEQLADGREWLFDTEVPGLADVTGHFVYNWIKGPMFAHVHDVFDTTKFPKTLSWIERLTVYLNNCANAKGSLFQDIAGEDASKLICSAAAEDLSIVGFDEVEANRLGVNVGDTVAVTPQDTGLIPTTGKLLALNREEVVIETHGSAGHVRCHFPRLTFSLVQQRSTPKM